MNGPTLSPGAISLPGWRTAYGPTVASAPTLATHNPTYRDQSRVIVDDATLADDLFDRLAVEPARLTAVARKNPADETEQQDALEGDRRRP